MELLFDWIPGPALDSDPGFTGMTKWNRYSTGFPGPAPDPDPGFTGMTVDTSLTSGAPVQ